MCGIAGFSNFRINYKEAPERWEHILERMGRAQEHRGPDDRGCCLYSHCGLSHVRLSVIDLDTGHQPMTAKAGGAECAVIYNGETYNMKELKKELMREGVYFQTESDTEVVLNGYIKHGCEFVKKMNGVFSFAVWDGRLKVLHLFRDRVGVKPLFYTMLGDTLLFASEIKSLFQYPQMEASVNQEGLCEIFGLGPAKTSGKGVFRNIHEVLPGQILTFGGSGMSIRKYWRLESRPHEDSYEKTVARTRELLTDAVKKQMLSDVPICTFLSGGVDSSLVTAICSQELRKQGRMLDTYSFDFVNNDVNFKSNAFQPSQDRPWVDRMKLFAQTNHTYLECGNEELYGYLFEAVDGRDLPCMADVESSMLYFCKQVAKKNKVALTGECADEIFGGYPWFHKKECFEADCFPWSMDFTTRTMLLKDEVRHELPLEEYARAAYHKTISETPYLEGENPQERRRREIAYLNLKWFMQTLLDRMDRTSMHAGLEARVPFADHRIIEYAWNVPWEMKCPQGVVKGLLRAAGEKYLPYDILYRKKSPYPKTYDPAYEALLKGEIREVLHDSSAPLNRLIDANKVEKFMNSPTDYGKPFYGQLMAGPQLLAYLLQVNYWLKKYSIRII